MEAHRAMYTDATLVNFGSARSRFRRHAKNSFSFFLSTIVSLHPAGAELCREP